MPLGEKQLFRATAMYTARQEGQKVAYTYQSHSLNSRVEKAIDLREE